MDFSKYKNRLLDYLHRRGHDVKLGSDFCFSPSHNNTDTPAAQYWDDNFICYSGECGIHGDIYDAVGILEGITDRKEQYLFLEKMYGGNWTPPPPQPEVGKKKESFTPDHNAETELENYLKKNPAAEKEITKFLNMRALSSSLGTIQSYPAELIPAMVKEFFYWPGLDLVRGDLGAETLRRAGVPLANPRTGIAWWEHSGVILKLGTGYKLHYYLEGQCKKFGSKGSSTFPMPGTIDKSKPIIIVEGEMDAVSSKAIGIENIFSAGGTNGITGPKVKKYLLEVPEIILVFDADEAGRKASGLIPIELDDKKRTNIAEIILRAGYTGKIKIGELPPSEQLKDQDALIIAGKKDIVLKAIKEAKEYIPPEKKADDKAEVKWDFLNIKRLQSILKKIKRADIEEKHPEDVQIFVSAIIKACKTLIMIKKDLELWGATKEEIENKNDVSPYELIEFAWEYEFSKYLQKIIELELTPASEFLKRIKLHKPIVDIDYEEIKENQNVSQFVDTQGVRSAALVVADILDGRIIYSEAEDKYYFFDGHTWKREPDMTGVIFNIISAIMRYFMEKNFFRKIKIIEIIGKIEGRRYRVEIMKEFSQLENDNVFKKSVLFDGPAVRETLTLKDGVIDFSGAEIIYRKSKPEEYRREILPYTIDEMKISGVPEKFNNFMKGNFKSDDTLQSLLYYLSLIPSRNTKYKYGGVFIGETNTGKTTTMDIIQAVYPEMINSIPAEILVGKGLRQVSGNEATPYIAQLEGKGAGLASETGRNLYLNNALWKLLTGGDKLPARNLYEKPHEFIPTAQILILTNYLPLFDSHDNATIGRMVIIPFLVEHKRGEKELIQIEEFIETLRGEFPAIVRLLAEYYIKLKHDYRGAIPLSDECKKYKQSYIEELDTDIDKFVKDRIEFDVSDDAFIKVKTVYQTYLDYYNFSENDSGKEALTQQKFTRYFKRDYKLVNYKQKKIDGKPELCFFNIRLKPYTGEAKEPSPAESPKAGGGYVTPPPDEMPF